MGVQALDDDELKRLGRTHSCSDILRAVQDLQSVFPDSFSIDLCVCGYFFEFSFLLHQIFFHQGFLHVRAKQQLRW